MLTPIYTWSLEVARAIKTRLDVPIIFGGVHPSAVPEICLENECVDYVCVGEGEQAIVELCDVLPSSGHRPRKPIANLWWRDGERLVRGPTAPFIQDLDSLPYFDKELWQDELRLGDNYITMTSRGCPYRCTFCADPQVYGGRWSGLDPERVLAELRELEEQLGLVRTLLHRLHADESDQ